MKFDALLIQIGIMAMLCMASMSSASERVLPPFIFEQISVRDGLPTNEIRQIYQDKDGFIWIATNSGLCQYDGTQIRVYKSNLHTPGLLSNNMINCVTDDNRHRLWMATYDGVSLLDKTTGEIRKLACRGMDRSIVNRILITGSDRVFIGTEKGLFEYFEDKDSCAAFLPGVIKGPVKALIEDSKRNLWIGTWSNGFYRYNLRQHQVYVYPPLNEMNSAFSIYEDRKQRIWVASWGHGLFLLKNPYEPEKLSWRQFLHRENDPSSLCDDIVYAIGEDLNMGYLWIGTRNGLSILYDEQNGYFENYYSDDTDQSVSQNDINSVFRDREGMMWLGLHEGGVNMVITRKPEFRINRLLDMKDPRFSDLSVRCLWVEPDGKVWMGVRNWGFFIYDPKTKHYTRNLGLPDFENFEHLLTVNTIVQSPTDGKIRLGTFDLGYIVYDPVAPKGKQVRRVSIKSASWLTNNCVFSIYEDRDRNTWFGTREGICVLKADGEGARFDSVYIAGRAANTYYYVSIVQDPSGPIWAGTSNGGVIRITGDPNHPEKMSFDQYSIEDGKLNSITVLCLFVDSRKRVWAGTEGGGLNLYDPEQDRFIPVHQLANLPGDAIYSMQEDGQGNFWVGTNVGLMKICVSDDLAHTTYRLYTAADGLQDDLFYRNVAFMTEHGEMFFGGRKGYNSFYPDLMVEEEVFPPICITDIKINNHSWSVLDESLRRRISKLTPGFTDRIRLGYRENQFSIDFATLSFTDPRQIKYAYKLDGFDAEWQYVDASLHFATYNNLDPGTYTFSVKSTNSSGTWSDKVRQLEVVILPPPWRSNWAYAGYFLLFCLLAYIVYRIVYNRIQLRDALRLQSLEQAKAEEVNHAKLQFFTNVTHELLTPLTILAAAVEELKLIAPQNGDHYQVMTSNINRLIRLIQQILEFRKAETGNLKLKVSQGDLAMFVRRSVDGFRPLIKKKEIQFSFVCESNEFPAWFDTDKVDKILYNLLSNAAKYNEPGGKVEIGLYAIGSEKANIVVKDNGKGFSEEAVKNLFKRFYEGEYRKFKTIGTGIGLSLTKDLVELHKGVITVHSKEGEGTAFSVTIPILRKFYAPEEIDESSSVSMFLPEKRLESGESGSEPAHLPENSRSLLLIEDNEDLLSLMVRLLNSTYRIYTATNGKEGLAILMQEEIDLVISDIMMPGMDGLEFCRLVKGQLETSHIPIVLLTAKNREEDRAEAYDAGADGFITKPFSMNVLHARINNLLKQRERISGDFKKQLALEINDLNYTSLDENFLQQAIDCVNRHLSDPNFDQQAFLEEMGTSKSTLYRKLKSLTGLNSSAFIRNIRLKAACRIMEEKKQHIRVSELAYAVGFNDPKYFSVCFKKEFGMQPTEYLEREKEI